MDTMISRRDLMKGAAATLAAGAVLGSFGKPAKAEEISAIEWAAECDVLVIGLGAAGATTAIIAAREGADVIAIDKAPLSHVGGNSAVCMQYIACTENAEGARTYLDRLRNGFETPSDAILDAYIEKVAGNIDFMVELGATDPTIQWGHPDYPEFDCCQDLPDFVVDGTSGGNGAAYKLLLNACNAAENITVWYEAEGLNLIQDADTKIVHGAEVLVDGQVVNVRAKRGVVLSCGGFEANRRMLQDYGVCKSSFPLGQVVYNTGDGIRMAMQSGANLWHMGNIVWHLDFVDAQTGYAPFRLAPKVANLGAIFVGDDATRFMDETYEFRHGTYPFHGSFCQLPRTETMWIVFDNKVMSAGPLYSTFSADNSAEVEKGWIVPADSVGELAEKIGLDPASLENTVEQYNECVANGADPFHGRRSQYLFSIDEGPFYAMPLYMTIVNTQGGPERNERGEILDHDGQPVPHLYGCGELGDIWSCYYQRGNNFGGGVTFGRITGYNAAQVKDDVEQGSLMGGRENYAPLSGGTYYETAPGQYLGEGYGKSAAPIVVRVTLEEGRIVSVEVLEHGETQGIGTAAIDELPGAIVAAGSVEVDDVTGATMTSEGIKEAVSNALSKADVIDDERAVIE